MIVKTIRKFVGGAAGVDSSSSPLSLYAMPNGQYSDYSFEGLEVPAYYDSIISVKLFFRKDAIGNAYLRFATTDGSNNDVDSYTAYAVDSDDGSLSSITIPSAAYNGLTVSSEGILAFKVERGADNVLDTYDADFQIAYIQVSFQVSTSLSGDILSLDELKAYLNKTNTEQDDFLSDWITIVSGQIQAYLDNPYHPAYKVVQETISGEIHDGDGSEFLFPEYFPISSVSVLQSRTSPDDDWSDIETNSAHIFTNARKNYIELNRTFFPFGRQNIKLSYVAGPETVPADIKRVALEMCAMVWKESNVSGTFQLGETSANSGASGISFNKNILDVDIRWKKVLDNYGRLFEWHPTLTR